MRWKLRYIGMAIAVAIGATAFADAAHAKGTLGGTTIGNRASVVWRTGTASRDTSTISIDTTVRNIFGETLTRSPNQDTQTFGVGETIVFTYQIVNNGNATDSFNVQIWDSQLFNGAVGWKVTLFVGANSTSDSNKILQTPLVPPDGVTSCSVQVVSNSNPANSPDGSNLRFFLRVKSESGPTATQYTGDNGQIYSAGGGQQDTNAYGLLASATISLVKVITSVSSPSGTGGLPVPGATITYQITYTVSGSSNADSAIIYDTIPTNTTADSMSSTINALGATATFVNDSSSTTGWTAQFSTSATPDLSYNSGDFVNLVGNEGTFGNARVVRWVRRQVGAGSATVRFRVIIK